MPNFSTILFFDGVCNLCNASVLFIIKRDKKARIRFAPLQGITAQNMIGSPEYDSLVLFEKGKIYYRSTAALKIASKLDGLWPLLYLFMIVPPFVRDYIYDIIATNRYKWFGKKQSCMIPTPELKSRFLE